MHDKPTILLLPGLEGTGTLFKWFARAIEPSAKAQIVRYPTDRLLAFDQLVAHIAGRAPADPYAIVAESFSGPAAVALASSSPAALRGIVLSTSFVAPPGPRWLSALPLTLLFRVPPPPAVLSWLLLGSSPTGEVVADASAAIRSVPAPILAGRLRQVLRIDARKALRECGIPVLYLAAKNDRVLGTRGLAAAREARPDIDFVSLDGPHMLLQAKPVEAAAVVASYLRRWFDS